MSQQQTFTERARARGLGLHCPACDHNSSSVTDSRLAPNSIRRRRVCEVCSFKWTTYESTEGAGSSVQNLDFFIDTVERFLKTLKAIRGHR